MPSFTDRLMGDRDINVALSRVYRETKNWPGSISRKQLAKFFRSGFIANNIDQSPGGFTLFMFRPTSHAVNRSLKEEQNAIRAQFGDGKLDEETVKFCAENEFFIASDTTQLETQISTGVLLLELFTGRNSIATEACLVGWSVLQENRHMFDRFFIADSLFGARFAHLIDKVFQKFCHSLANCRNERRPIRAARGSLERSMHNDLRKALAAIELGSMPNLVLPPALLETESVDKGIERAHQWWKLTL